MPTLGPTLGPTPDQIEKIKEAFTRRLNRTFAKDLGRDPNDDVLRLFIDRTLAQVGLLPREVLAEMTAERRAVVLVGMTEDEACANRCDG